MKYYKVKNSDTYYRVHNKGFETLIPFTKTLYNQMGYWNFDTDDMCEPISKEIYELNLLKML